MTINDGIPRSLSELNSRPSRWCIRVPRENEYCTFHSSYNSEKITTLSIGMFRLLGADESLKLIGCRVWFRPRILRDVSHVDYSSKILGFNSSMPIYITATALGESSLLMNAESSSPYDIGKLGHPEGEVTLTRAAAKHNVIQMVSLAQIGEDTAHPFSQIPTLASCAFDEMVDAAASGQIQFLQL